MPDLELDWDKIQARLKRLAKGQPATDIDEQLLIKALALLGLPATIVNGVVTLAGARGNVKETARTLCKMYKIPVGS